MAPSVVAASISQMRHVLIGSTGFVGRHLLEALADEPVLAFARSRPIGGRDSGFVQGDICVAADVERIGIRPDDVVYHLAARHLGSGVPGRGRQAWFDEVNVHGTRNLLLAMRRSGASRLIFFSTDMTYGLPQALPVTPDHPQVPLGPYGRSKVVAEQIVRDAVKEGYVKATILRPRFIVGPGRYGPLAILFSLIASNLPVPMIGDGRNRWQMISVNDCVRVSRRVVEADFPPGPFNIGSESPKTLREVLREIIRYAGSRSWTFATPSRLVKRILAMLDASGRPIMYPEQYLTADVDFYMDTSTTRAGLNWSPEDDDIETLTAAYDAFVAAKRH
jgi:dTDP-glucose 4,6-dehydratase